MIKKLLRIFIGLIVLVFAVIAGFFLFLTITDYRPEPVENLNVVHGENLPEFNDSVVTIFSWNIGYGGLGKEMDFFHEGGHMVRPDQEKFNRYFKGICSLIDRYKTTDFIFIQETDTHSKRSYYTDEPAGIATFLPDFGYSFGKNYDCRFVPVPVFEPMGRAVSGITTFTRFKPVSVEKFDYGTHFSWPTDLVMLKRCFMVIRFPMKSGKELVLINTHNSVFDSGAVMRKKELKVLHDFAIRDYNKGNFVIIGGDWNMNPRGFIPDSINTGDKVRRIYPPISDEFLPDWKFLFDNSKPSNRDVNEPYQHGNTYTTIIDFFVISPNIDAIEVNTLEQEFVVSDHNPVVLKVSLRR